MWCLSFVHPNAAWASGLQLAPPLVIVLSLSGDKSNCPKWNLENHPNPPFLCSSILHLVMTTESLTAPSCNLDAAIVHIENGHLTTMSFLDNLKTKNSLSSLFQLPLFFFVGDKLIQWSWINHLILKEYVYCFVVLPKDDIHHRQIQMHLWICGTILYSN